MNNAQITLIGNTTNDPELKFVGSSPKLDFSLAVDRSYKDKNDEWQNETSFFNIIAWRDVAENTARALGSGRGKGVRLIVTGRMVQKSWDDKETGQKRYGMEVVADEIAISTRHVGEDYNKFVPEKKDGGNGGQRTNSRPAPKPQQNHIPEEEAW